MSVGLALLYLGMGCTQGQSNAGLASRAARYKQRIIEPEPAGRGEIYHSLPLSLFLYLSDLCQNTKIEIRLLAGIKEIKAKMAPTRPPLV